MKENHAGGRWDWTHPTGTQLTIDNVYPHRDSLTAWIEIRHGNNDPLVRGTKNLRGARTVSDLVRECGLAYPSIQVDWRQIIADCTYEIIRYYQEGEPFHDLAEIAAKPRERPRYLLHPLVRSSRITSLIGPGGSLKSYLALAALATITTGSERFGVGTPQIVGPGVYLDFEDEGDEQGDRLNRLCKGAGVPLPNPRQLLYESDTTPLVNRVRALEKRIVSDGIVFGVIDSAIGARGGMALDQDETARLFNAANETGIPWLMLDHVTKADRRGGIAKGAFGPEVSRNIARLQWQVMSGPPETPVLQLRWHKGNSTGALPDLAFRIEFDRTDNATECRITRTDPGVVSVTDVPVRERVSEGLVLADRRGTTVKELSEGLGVVGQSVSNELQALKRQGVAVLLKGRWFSNVAQGELPVPY